MSTSARLLMAVIVLALASQASAETVVWSPRVQVSHTTADGDSVETMVRGLAFQRDGNDGLHAMLAVDKTGNYTQEDGYNGNGFYLSVAGDLNWGEAWDNRWQFTLDDTEFENSWVSADHSMIIDSDNEVHAIFEDFLSSIPSNPGACGYKTSGSARWSDEIRAWILPYDGDSTCTNGSPTFFLWEDGAEGTTSGDSLHAVIHQRGTNCTDHKGWREHWKKSLAAADSTWIPGGFVRDEAPAGWTFGSGPLVVVDDFGFIHLLMTSNYDDIDRRYVLHAWGHQTGPEILMNATVDTLDQFTIYGGEEEEGDLQADVSIEVMRGASDFVDVAWNHALAANSTEVRFSRIDISDSTEFANNSTPIRISPDVGPRHGRARVSHDAAGNVYAIYQNGDSQANGTQQLMSVAVGDPTDQGNWARGIAVTPGVETWAGDAFLLARNDSLFTLYESHDDEDDANEDKEAWFQLGHVVPDSVPAGQTTVWAEGSQVALSADFVIAAGCTLVVEAGVSVAITSNTDLNNRGRYPTKTEIINRGGVIRVLGEANDRVTFRSTAGGEGEWGGFWFDVAAAASGYGFTTASRIENADIEDATEGIGIENTGAPTLVGLSFDDIVSDRHILIDSTDVYVPYTGEWSLEGPMRVKVTRGTRIGQDIVAYGDTLDAGKVNVVVHGELNTTGSNGNRVIFEPDVVPPSATTGNEWGGILVDWVSSGSVMQFLDVGYAMTPLSLIYQNAVVEDSRFHHFRDRAIWAYGMGTTVGPQLVRNTVFRDTTGTASLFEEVGLDGIVLEKLVSGLLDGNAIELTDMVNAAGGSGISYFATASYCSTNTAQPETLRVTGCTVVGPGAGAEAGGGAWSGFRAAWLCGTNNKKIHIEGNQFTEWNEAAFSLVQCSDIQFNCNNDDASSNRGGVIFSRTSASGSDVRFKGNVLRIHDDSTQQNQEVVRTDDAVNLALGQSSVMTKGKNQFLSVGADWYVEENDSGSSDFLQCQSNYWKRNGIAHTLADSILAHVTYDSGITGDPARVTTGTILSTPPTNVCGAPFGNIRNPGAVDSDGAEDSETNPPGTPSAGVALVSSALPGKSGIQRISPMPVREGARIEFDLAPGYGELLRLDVVDVRGRRVASLVEGALAPGRYSVSWDGRESGGGLVSAGVYFLRFTAGGSDEVRKLVVIR